MVAAVVDTAAASIGATGIVKVEGNVIRVEVDILGIHMVEVEDGLLSLDVITSTNLLEHCYC
jgi:hypothetical protein